MHRTLRHGDFEAQGACSQVAACVYFRILLFANNLQ